MPTWVLRGVRPTHSREGDRDEEQLSGSGRCVRTSAVELKNHAKREAALMYRLARTNLRDDAASASSPVVVPGKNGGLLGAGNLRRGDKGWKMSLVRWNPFRELEDMSTRLNRIFGQSTAPRAAGEAGDDSMLVFDWSPMVDVVETPEEFQIKAELPEVKKEDVRVFVDEGILRIEGERKQEKEDKGKKYHRVERSYGSFLRTFTLPDYIDDSKVRAEFKDGVLNVRLPKTEKAKPKAVEVKVA